MKKFIQTIDFADVLVVGGSAGLSIGLWMYEPWISLAVVGGLFFGLGIFLSTPRVTRKNK